MKKIKILSIVCSLCMMFTIFRMPISAAGVSVSASSSTVNVGDSVTFTVSGSGAGTVTISGAVNQTIWLENSSQSFTVTATAPGSLNVSVSGVMADFETETDVPVSSGASVQVIARQEPAIPTTPEETPSEQPSTGENTPEEQAKEEQERLEEQKKQEEEERKRKEQEEDKENDLRLSNLSVSKGTLAPDFDSDTYSYDVTVDESVKSLRVDATPKDENVSVQGTGKKLLKEETTVIELECSSKNTDRTSIYTVTVHKRQRGLVLKNDKDEEFEILQDEIPEIEGFSEYVLNIEGNEVKARRNENNGLVLLYCLNEKQESNFYIYDESENKVVSVYIPVTLFSKNYAIVDVKEDLSKQKEFKKSTLEIDGQEIEGYRFKDKTFENYAIVYLMNENAESYFYQFETTENTLQKYSDAAAITQDAYKNLLIKQSQSNVIIIAMMAVITVLIIGSIIIIILFKREL